MFTILIHFNSKNFGTCSLSIIEIIDTQVARRGRQYHSQPSYKRQKLVPTRSTTYKKQNRPTKSKSSIKKSKIRKSKKNQNNKLTILPVMTAIQSSLNNRSKRTLILI